jgi:putative transposase
MISVRREPGRPTSCVGTTSTQRHAGHDKAILEARHEVYIRARERNPARWSGNTRNWSPVHAVTLNPERGSAVNMAAGALDKQPQAA